MTRRPLARGTQCAALLGMAPNLSTVLNAASAGAGVSYTTLNGSRRGPVSLRECENRAPNSSQSCRAHGRRSCFGLFQPLEVVIG